MMNRAKMFRSAAAIVPPSKVVTRSVAAGHPEIELRFTEVRAEASSTGKRLEGYASVFNTRAQLPGFQERIMPGAFDKAINEKQDCVALWNHNQDFPLGRVAAGTLTLDSDSRGLHYKVDLPDTSWGNDAWQSIKRGDVVGSSFGFTVAPDDQTWSQESDSDGNNYVLRSINNISKLFDVSPVISPCYQGTAVQARVNQVSAEVRSMAMKYFRMPTEAECLAITHRAEIRRQQEQITQRRQAIIRSWLLD